LIFGFGSVDVIPVGIVAWLVHECLDAGVERIIDAKREWIQDGAHKCSIRVQRQFRKDCS